MERETGSSTKSASIQVVVTIILCLLFLGAYVAALRALVDVSVIETDADANRRDTVYAFFHLGFLTLASVVGFVVGKWLNGLGLAYALLFFIVVTVGMLSVQIGSYELACHGYNGIVRNWQC